MQKEKARFQGFEGLRAFAILMVIAGHAGALSNTAGGIGNKIFFVLSGFLAYFSTKNIKDFHGLLQFYMKKAVRIVPAYWLVILAAWRMFPGVFILHDMSTDQSLILNLLFVKSYGHLWFMQQIMLMYFCVPLLQYVTRHVKKITETRLGDAASCMMCAALAVILALLEKNFLTADVLKMSGQGSHAQFQAWIFMFGFAFACIYEGLLGLGLPKNKKIANIITDFYAPAVLFLLFIFVIPSFHETYSGIALVMDSGTLRTILSCIAVLLLAITADSLIAKIFSCPPFKVISDISFGIYMVHFFLLGYFQTGSVLKNFLSNFVISMCVAYFIHVFLEQPIAAKWKASLKP